MANEDGLDIPECLKVPRDYVPPPLNGRRLRWTRDMTFGKRRTMSAADRKVEEAAKEQARKLGRFTMLDTYKECE